MSNEVKRIKVYHLRETFCPRALLVADESPMPDHESFLIQAEDHDRIVAELNARLNKVNSVFKMWVSENETIAELRAEVERLKRANQVVPKDAELLALNGKFRDTIATQKRVIAILKACILREDFRCGRWPAGREAIDQAESVERGER